MVSLHSAEYIKEGNLFDRCDEDKLKNLDGLLIGNEILYYRDNKGNIKEKWIIVKNADNNEETFSFISYVYYQIVKSSDELLGGSTTGFKQGLLRRYLE